MEGHCIFHKGCKTRKYFEGNFGVSFQFGASGQQTHNFAKRTLFLFFADRKSLLSTRPRVNKQKSFLLFVLFCFVCFVQTYTAIR